MRAAHRQLPNSHAPMLITIRPVTVQAKRGADQPGRTKSTTPSTPETADTRTVSRREAADSPAGARERGMVPPARWDESLAPPRRARQREALLESRGHGARRGRLPPAGRAERGEREDGDRDLGRRGDDVGRA